MSKKKPYRAFAEIGKQSVLKRCGTLEEAREFLASKGGCGLIEKHAHKIIYASGHGLGRVEYDPPLRLDDWQFVERIGVKKLSPRPNATSGFWIELDFRRIPPVLTGG